MGFFTSVKNAGAKAKLKGEIALLDREIQTRRHSLGVELYNLLQLTEHSKTVNIATPSIFHANESQIKIPYEACRADLRILQNEMEAKRLELERIAVNRERARPPRTNQERLEKAGSWMSDTGSEAKLQVELKMLERKMKSRKEKFGVDVCEHLDTLPSKTSESTAASRAMNKTDEKKKGSGRLGILTGGSKSPVSGVKSGIASQFSKLSKSEKEIQECLGRAKRDITFIENQKDLKNREIERLEESQV
jgi:hypothetical protein